MNVFGIEPKAKAPAAVMAMDAMASMSPMARLDLIRVVLDGYTWAQLEAFSNEIGRVAHEKHRAEMRDVASAGDCPSLLDPAEVPA